MSRREVPLLSCPVEAPNNLSFLIIAPSPPSIGRSHVVSRIGLLSVRPSLILRPRPRKKYKWRSRSMSTEEEEDVPYNTIKES